MDKEYKITFTSDYIEYKEWAKTDEYWKEKLENNADQLALCEKYSGKIIKLSEIPEFVKEVGSCVITENEIEVYNDYRE